mgnify:CR=1 FL=1
MLGAIIGDIVGSRYEWHNNKSKDFVAGENLVYYGELPLHLAKKGVSKNVARTELFALPSAMATPLHSKAVISMLPHT